MRIKNLVGQGRACWRIMSMMAYYLRKKLYDRCRLFE